MAEQTPLMKQYWDIKHQHLDAILFFRLGDFYEMFFEDAQIAAEELELTLTSRGKSAGEPIPLAGIPYHSYRTYAARLLKKGYKVAVCEQVEDPKQAKGLVDRAVTQVLTPGTVIDDGFLEGGTYNYLLCLCSDGDGWAIAYCDVSAGDVRASCSYGSGSAERIVEEITKVGPSEIIGPSSLVDTAMARTICENVGLSEGAVSWNDDLVVPHRCGASVFFEGGEPGADVRREPLVERALASLAGYVNSTQGDCFDHFRGVVVHDTATHMGLDPATIRNLEILRTIMGGERKGSLLWVLDRTVTAMGARLLKYWVVHPLTDRSSIEKRLDRVEGLLEGVSQRQDMRRLLRRVYDIPRITSRVSAKRANGRDLVALCSSLETFVPIAGLCRDVGLAEMGGSLDGFEELATRLAEALASSPPLGIMDGGLMAQGYDEELDELRRLATNAQGWLEEFQASERERTGIKSLKVRHNKVFGYYIEVTKANLERVPAEYQRKQTLVGSERFITEALKEKEGEILSAEERGKRLEYSLFVKLRDEVSSWTSSLQRGANNLAELDVLCSLAEVAEEGAYTRPQFSEDGSLTISDGRHPVVERMGAGAAFIPNDLTLGTGNDQIIILTGPNMSGKSTYLRQAGLVVLLAQLGSFVPAGSANLSIVDKIFTRVGAGDDLTRGESTFMVEMKETAHILQNATPSSLIILDEVGRGTSTYDGLSLAWAIVEYINQVPERKAKTLFATHYHELTEMADIFGGIVNLSVLVEERGDDVLFLHRIVPGSAGRSYGIHVAKLAGFPQRVLDKANEVLYELERDEQRDIERKRLRSSSRRRREEEAIQLSLFTTAENSPVLDELRRCDPNRMTPMDALTALARWRKML